MVGRLVTHARPGVGVAASQASGSVPLDWKGRRTEDGWACQGNRLTGPQVLDAAIEAFLAQQADAHRVERLLAALDAGEAAGGDTRGHISAEVYDDSG